MLARSVPRRDLLSLIVFTLGTLLPFVGRPFNIDEPLFLWAARQILVSPGDFYGFSVNWYGIEQPMHEVTKNPPLASAYLALIGSMAGWSEVALHAAFLLPALGTALGTYRLARRICSRAVEATLIGLMTPVFLVSSSIVMCDTMMLCLYVWSIVLWIEGLETGRSLTLTSASVLIAASGLTKYFGISLVPLLLVYSLYRMRRPGRWMLYLLIPSLVWAGYQGLTLLKYGHGLIGDASGYALSGGNVTGASLPARALIGLFFTGGCLLPGLLYAPFIWSRRVLFGGCLLFGLAAIVFGRDATAVGPIDLSHLGSIPTGLKVQMLLAGISGASVLGLALVQLRRRGDALGGLLAIWILGVFIFASFVNWTNNGRSILPMAPAVGILLARRIEERWKAKPKRLLRALALPLLPGLAVALVVTWADARWAGSIREAAQSISVKYQGRGTTLWFQGHWGFQYYMQLAGAKPIDVSRDRPQTGDWIAIPINNVDITPLPGESVNLVEQIVSPEPTWIRTLSWNLGAGFYSSVFGPLPYAVGKAAPDRYVVFQVRQPFSFGAAAKDE